jgi:hypothetical protein
MSKISLIFFADSLYKKLLRLTLLGLLIGLIGIISIPDYKVVGQQSPTQSCPTCKPPTQQVVYTPLIESKDSSYAEINLNCRSSHLIDVVPTFYTADGTPVVGETIQLHPAEMRFINVQSLIPAERRGKHDWGGMSLSYTGNTMEVWAQMTFHGTSEKGSVNPLFVVVDAPRSNVREAVWRMPKNAVATIALGNYSDAPAAATLAFSNGDVEQINLAPYATEIIERRNNEQNRTSVESESVRINSSGQLGRVIATGFVSSDKGDFGSSIRFADTENVAQPNLYSTNFRLKDTTPRIVLKNTTTAAITARPRFLPMTGEGSSRAVELPVITIQPNAVKEVNLTPLINVERTRSDLDSVSVQIINSGGAGSLIGAANFTNNVTGINYDIPLRDSGTANNSAGGYPIRLDGDYTTNLSITNVDDKAGKFTLQVNFDGGIYAMYPRELAQGETAVFDFRRIRDQQIPDSSGRVLPLNLTIGQIRWSMVGVVRTKMIGRSEIVSQSGKVSSSYSCGVCCGNRYDSSFITPNYAAVDFGDTLSFAGRQVDGDCYGNLYSPYDVFASWSSSNTGVAEVNLGDANAVGVGIADITATWDVTINTEGFNYQCDSHVETVAQTANMDVRPSVSIDNFKAVGKDFTTKVRVTVSNNPNNQDITLTLAPNSGTTGVAQFTSNNSTTRTITSTTDVEIKGITESSTKDNMRLTASLNGRSYGSGEDFTVISVSLSLRYSNGDPVSSDNSARQVYQQALGTYNLGGPFLSSGTGTATQWRIGIEVKAIISPTNFSNNLKLKREFVSAKNYTRVNAASNFTEDTNCLPLPNSSPPPCPDDSDPLWRDDTPSIVYDLDAPGSYFTSGAEVGRVLRRRNNFRQWATISQKNGGTTVEDVRVSSDINWYFRLSIYKTATGTIEVLSDVPGDNTIGMGTTSLSATNLQ